MDVNGTNYTWNISGEYFEWHVNEYQQLAFPKSLKKPKLSSNFLVIDFRCHRLTTVNHGIVGSWTYFQGGPMSLFVARCSTCSTWAGSTKTSSTTPSVRTRLVASPPRCGSHDSQILRVPQINRFATGDGNPGWWFGTWILWLSIQLGIIIIPTDEVIFFRGVGIPPTNTLFSSDCKIFHG